MIPTNDELRMFMKMVYKETEGYLLRSLNMWKVGEALEWDERKTELVYERLANKDFIEGHPLSGSIRLTLDGLDFCERTFTEFPDRQENRRRMLKAIYNQTEGSSGSAADLWAVGKSLGLSDKESRQVYLYLKGSYLVESRGGGGMASLTQYGIEFIEEELRNLEPLEAAVASAEEPEPEGIPDTGERRFAFFSIDIVGHSRFVTSPDYQRSEVSRTLDAFSQLVDEEANKRSCLKNNWAGDGGLYLFRGDGCQGRTYGAARAILRRLPEFNRIENTIGELLQIRIAAHTDFFKMPDDIAKIHDASIILVDELQKDANPNTIVVTSKLYKDLDQQQKQELEQLPNHEGGFALYCYRLLEEDQ